MPVRRRSLSAAVPALALPVLVLVSSCSGAGGGSTATGGSSGGTGGGGGGSINVLMVNNPQQLDLQKLTADHFTKQTGIKVNYTVLPENDVRDKIS